MRYTWQIGDLEFRALKDNGGWWFSALIGRIIVIDDEYHDGPIREVMAYSATWARDYALNLLSKAETFDPSEVI